MTKLIKDLKNLQEVKFKEQKNLENNIELLRADLEKATNLATSHSILQNIKGLEKDLSSVKGALLRIKLKLRKLEPKISNYAVLKYLERVCGIPVGRVERFLKAQLESTEVPVTDKRVKIPLPGSGRMVIQDNVMVDVEFWNEDSDFGKKLLAEKEKTGGVTPAYY